ncbi:hypothetical protein C7H79_00760 [Nitrosomonas supralitoralis]|uniref:Uncharacterized protein n=1 Tax=Nitrosomonas supralitoralis TaxID=2116706 RepID=A0A2P7NZA9_9PROT|nr:hypothetical protein C7H79_00760 [Nitrosomonas supralitoralis]
MRVRKEFLQNKKCFPRWVSNLCGILILYAVYVIKYKSSKFSATGDSTSELPVVGHISNEQILARDQRHSLAMFGEYRASFSLVVSELLYRIDKQDKIKILPSKDPIVSVPR